MKLALITTLLLIVSAGLSPRMTAQMGIKAHKFGTSTGLINDIG